MRDGVEAFGDLVIIGDGSWFVANTADFTCDTGSREILSVLTIVDQDGELEVGRRVTFSDW